MLKVGSGLYAGDTGLGLGGSSSGSQSAAAPHFSKYWIFPSCDTTQLFLGPIIREYSVSKLVLYIFTLNSSQENGTELGVCVWNAGDIIYLHYPGCLKKNVGSWKNSHNYPQIHPKCKCWGKIGKFRIFATIWALRFSKLKKKWLRKWSLKLPIPRPKMGRILCSEYTLIMIDNNNNNRFYFHIKNASIVNHTRLWYVKMMVTT